MVAIKNSCIVWLANLEANNILLNSCLVNLTVQIFLLVVSLINLIFTFQFLEKLVKPIRARKFFSIFFLYRVF